MTRSENYDLCGTSITIKTKVSMFATNNSFIPYLVSNVMFAGILILRDRQYDGMSAFDVSLMMQSIKLVNF